MGQLASKLCGSVRICVGSEALEVHVDTKVPSKSGERARSGVAAPHEEKVEDIEFTDLSQVATVDVYVDYDEQSAGAKEVEFLVDKSIFLDKENTKVSFAAGEEALAVPKTPPVPADFNGIPNGSSKYSERKGITTHCTPFEERIERALQDLSGNVGQLP